MLRPQRPKVRNVVPTSDPLEALDTTVNVALALIQDPGGVVDGLALLLQLRKRVHADGLGLVRQCLAGLEPLRASIQPVRPCNQVNSASEKEQSASRQNAPDNNCCLCS